MGQKFKVYTDHKPLEKLNIKNCKDVELLQILNYISQFDFGVIYNPGKYNVEADCLSRNPVLEERNDEDDSESVVKIVNFLRIDEIKEDQKHLKADENCEINNDIIYKIFRGRKKLWLTEEFGKALIGNTHYELGHIGVKQLNLMITHIFYFKNMHRHIKEICKSCETCIKNKTRIYRNKAPLAQLGPATKPLEIVSVDTIGGFAGNKSTKKYLHLIVDHFTRYAFIITSKTQLAKDFVALVKKVENKDRIKILLADQYPGINSDQFKQYLKSEGIQIIFTAVDCAFSNGLNERANQTLVNRIRCKIYENRGKPWSVIAEKCVEEYNNTVHSSTGFTPKYLLTGVDSPVFPDETRNKRGDLEENRSLALQRSKKDSRTK